MSGSTERDAAREALIHWFLGLLVGGIAGIAPLALGTIGLALAIRWSCGPWWTAPRGGAPANE